MDLGRKNIKGTPRTRGEMLYVEKVLCLHLKLKINFSIGSIFFCLVFLCPLFSSNNFFFLFILVSIKSVCHAH